VEIKGKRSPRRSEAMAMPMSRRRGPTTTIEQSQEAAAGARTAPPAQGDSAKRTLAHSSPIGGHC
jgi:hypothetical protein